MADKVTLMKKWFDDIKEDPNFDTTDQEMAYIMYAALIYGFTGEKVDLGEVFGKEFKGLNRSMSNVYGQIDRIQNYDPSDGKNIKYDAEAIKECRLKGLTAKETCIELGYPEEKARSITSNKGWVEAGKLLKIQKSTESVQVNEKVQKSEKSVQKNTDLLQTESTEKSEKNTENTESVQNLSNKAGATFEF